MTTDRNLPSAKTPSPSQRQTGTPQTIPDEAAWTDWEATTGAPDAAERPGKGAADRCLKNTAAAESRNPQSPREIAVNIERCSWTQSSTVDKLPTCKRDCVGEPPIVGLDYVDKLPTCNTGCVGEPPIEGLGYVDKLPTCKTGCVGEPPIEGLGYVDKLPTCNTGCVGEPPIEGLGYVAKPSIDETGQAGNPASGDSGFVGKTSTGVSGYVKVG